MLTFFSGSISKNSDSPFLLLFFFGVVASVISVDMRDAARRCGHAAIIGQAGGILTVMSQGHRFHVAPTMLLLLAGASLLAHPAWAQQGATPPPAAASEPAADNEIVVTATRREEKLQDVAASITAFTSQTIERSSITRPIDFINATPNLSAVEANNAGDLRITIRGDAQALNTDAPVAVVIDGVVLTGATGLNKDLLDVQQIEVLKGPQGAIYGRNAIAGAINIVTKRPGDRLSGEALAGYGSGEPYKVLTGRHSGAIRGFAVPGQPLHALGLAYRIQERPHPVPCRVLDRQLYRGCGWQGIADRVWFARHHPARRGDLQPGDLRVIPHPDISLPAARRDDRQCAPLRRGGGLHICHAGLGALRQRRHATPVYAHLPDGIGLT